MMANETQARLEKLLGFLQVDTDNFALLSDAADLSMQLGDFAVAKNLVKRALTLQPQDPLARYRTAVILLSERKPEDSVAITQALLEEGHLHAAVRFEHARSLVMLGRFDEAEPIFAGLLPEAASFRELPQLYIRTLHHLGKVDEAIAFASKYMNDHPEDGSVQGMLSLLHLDNNDIAQAAELSAKALERAPNNMDALLTAGSVALAYENETDAKTYFDKAIAIYGNSGRAWAGLGLVNMLAMDLPAARNDFERAVEFMPTHLGSQNALAWIQILQRDYAAAKKTLQASLDIDRTFGETHGGLAVLAAVEGDWDNAKRLAEMAVRLQPESFSGRFAQSLIMTHRGHPERAQAMVETVFKNFQVAGGGTLNDALRRFVVRQQNKPGK